MKEQQILITGAAGFIGLHLAKKLLEKGYPILGIDNLNDYYNPQLKKDRLQQLEVYDNFRFYYGSIEDKNFMNQIFLSEKISKVVNLAAQAGVRYSLENPYAYIDTNIYGFLNILECCRHYKVEHLVYASSSSVYGLNEAMPFREEDSVNHPISLYAATKKSNEMMAHVYSHLFGLPTTGLRFFTVYGPWGRPDMALFMFTKAILNGDFIDVFNNGDMLRDFTYVDDIVEGIAQVLECVPSGNEEWSSLVPDPSTSSAPYTIFNIGNNSPVKLMDYIHAIENATEMQAKINYLPMQPGDVPKTYASTSKLNKLTGFESKTSVDVGVRNFVRWYREYYEI